MTPETYTFQSIGIIHSPHKILEKTPIQPVFCRDIKGSITLDEEYIDGLMSLHEFSHIYLFYYFNHSNKTSLRLKPFLSDQEQGIFATRAPHRPNKLGMSLVRLDKIEGNALYVRDLDVMDGTPLLDIKPYIQRFDSRDEVLSGWQEGVSNDEAAVRGLREFKDQTD